MSSLISRILSGLSTQAAGRALREATGLPPILTRIIGSETSRGVPGRVSVPGRRSEPRPAASISGRWPGETADWTFPRMPVTSSNLDSIAYNSDDQRLQVWFKNGGVYEYAEVPLSVFYGLREANSKGGFFYYFIRLKNYSYVKLN